MVAGIRHAYLDPWDHPIVLRVAVAGGLNPYPVAVLQYCLAASHYPNREPLV